MFMAIGIISMLAVIVLIILAIIFAFKRMKKAKLFFIMAGICFVIMCIAVVNDSDKEKLLTSLTTETTTQSAQTPTPVPNAPETTVSHSATSVTITGPQQEEVKAFTEPGNKRIPAKITKVIDGDTMSVSFEDGGQMKHEKIRLLLVDTPETVAPNKPVELFGPEASAFAKETLNGKDVQLEMDVSERDKYGRLLCYLYVGDQMFNELLLKKGLARVAYVYPPNVKYVDQFRDIQRTAQQGGIGIWSIENYAQEDGFHDEAVTTSAKTNSSPTTPPAVVPKPTVTPKQEESIVYKNCTAVKAAGAAPLMRGELGYSSKLDRDGDGVACEK